MDTPKQEVSPADVKTERAKIYGESELSHENIGLAWTGAIQQHYGIRLPYPIPAWLVELMMGQFKIQRATRVFHEDNYVDLYNYVVDFAQSHQKKDPRAQLPMPKAPAPKETVGPREPRHRTLGNTEVIKEGDEFESVSGFWFPCLMTVGLTVAEAQRRCSSLMSVRRKVS